jgi:hypothetical protein
MTVVVPMFAESQHAIYPNALSPRCSELATYLTINIFLTLDSDPTFARQK